MKLQKKQCNRIGRQNGSVLVLVLISMTALFLLGMGLMSAAYGVRHRALMVKNEAAAMLAAEGGYEKAIFWMSQQQDMLDALIKEVGGTNGVLSFPNAKCNYKIQLHTFAGNRPIYRVISSGSSGTFNRTVDVKVMQATSGWDMGSCRIATGSTSTSPVYFASGEIIDMPIHINNFKDNPDKRDIYISGSPKFLEGAGMGESQYTSGGSDKYSDVMKLFDEGIDFDQPEAKINDESSVQAKINRFKDTTKSTFSYKPVATAGSKISGATPAVQLEFFVSGGVGKVRITNHCTVRSFMQSKDDRTLDFKVKPGSKGEKFTRYGIYAYHVKDNSVGTVTKDITDTYVSQKVGSVESLPGGQIFVDGNVVIGGDETLHDNGQVVKGTITVVATGNIWVADTIQVDGDHDKDGMPSADNPNIIGLISQGVIKVVDPGMTEYSYVDNGVDEPSGFTYAPIGVPDEGTGGGSGGGGSGGGGYGGGGYGGGGYGGGGSGGGGSGGGGSGGGGSGGGGSGGGGSGGGGSGGGGSGGGGYGGGGYGGGGYGGGSGSGSTEDYERHLPKEMVVEAAMTIGGGGWGAENVVCGKYGDRKEDPDSSKQDNLIVHGTITEVLRGVVGAIGKDGFNKQYYMDSRLLEGILPGDIWLSGKYVPTPAGWHDYRPDI